MAELPMDYSKVPTCWVHAALRTMKASRWEVFLARIFGRRFTGEDMDHEIVGHEWRGKLYMTDYKKRRSPT